MKKRRRKQKFDKQMQKKLLGVFAFVLLVLVILNLKIAYINIKSGDKYAKQVLSQKEYDSRTIPYRRGEIQDRNGNVLARSEKVYTVIARRSTRKKPIWSRRYRLWPPPSASMR